MQYLIQMQSAMASRMYAARSTPSPLLSSVVAAADAPLLRLAAHQSGNTWSVFSSLLSVSILLPLAMLTFCSLLSYANSVLQALYFCSPFRELVCNTPDRSYLYLLQPLQHPPPSTSPPAAYVPSSKPANYSKAPATPQRRVLGAAYAPPDAKPDASTVADVDGKDPNTGPPIPSYSPTLFAALRYLFLHIAHHSVNRGTIAPTAFIAKLRKENELFRNTQHQDAHEFLNYLLNKIVEELEQEDRQAANRPSPAPSQSQNPPDDCESAH